MTTSLSQRKFRPPEAWKHLKFWDHVYNKRKLERSIFDRERLSGRRVLPPKELWFRALEYTSPEDVKCVILGQDPYHTPGLAHGLAFSVMPDVKNIPPSLKNIFKEYMDDLGYPKPRNGYLKPWADQGVLLLNTCLTVDQGKPFSHNKMGWDLLTYEVLRSLQQSDEPICFVFWGKHAAQYLPVVTNDRHGVVTSGHPSPLALGSGEPFLGSKPFSSVNNFLQKFYREVNWRLPS